MRIVFSFLLFTFYFASTAQIPSYIPTNGLVGYWPFNGNANDVSGNGYNGVVVGPSLTFDRFGNANSAYKFSNGIDYIYTSNPYTATNVLTYSIWIKSNATNGGFVINFNNGQVQHGGMWCKTIIVDTNAITFFTYQGGNTRNVFNLSLLDNAWHNYVVTMDINGSKIYIDGNLKSANPNQNSGQIYTGFYRFGGLCPNDLNNSLIGIYDDICIWNRALTQTEITQLYTSSNINTTPEDSTSNVGIGTTTPKRKLHINDVMRLEPRNTAPTNPGEGDIYYDGLLKKLRYYNGTGWISL